MRIRADFHKRKSTHFKLPLDVHIAFRLACIKRGLNMQEAFEELARAVAAEEGRGIFFLDRIVRRRLKSHIADMSALGLRPLPKTVLPEISPRKDLSEHDRSALYDLISDSDEEDDDDEVA